MLLVTCLSSFLAPFMGSALNLAIPAIGGELHVSAVMLNWIVGAYLLASAAFLLPFGRLADLYGRRRVFLGGALAHAMSSAAAALAWSAPALLSPVAGRLSDRVEPRLVASAGMALTFLGLALFAAIDQGTALSRVVACLVLIGVGFGLFSSPNTNAVMSAVERRHYGVAAATLGTMRLVGQAASLALVALVFAHFMGTARISNQTAPLLLAGMRTAFAIFAGLCAIGTGASLARGRLRA